MIRLSVIVPAFNEEATIVELLSRVARQRIDGVELEVIVVDDGSTDRTLELLLARPDLYARLLQMPVNGGKGAAVKAGLEAATGDYVLFQDADLEYEPDDYRLLLEPVLRHDADLVMGSRLNAPQFTRVHYFWHKVGNQVLSLTFNVFNNTTFTDIYTCYLLFRRSLLDVGALGTSGWEQQAEILSQIVPRAEVIYEVPINYHGRTYAQGKKIRAHHTVAVIQAIVSGWARERSPLAPVLRALRTRPGPGLAPRDLTPAPAATANGGAPATTPRAASGARA